jgi:hypothetical protein
MVVWIYAATIRAHFVFLHEQAVRRAEVDIFEQGSIHPQRVVTLDSAASRRASATEPRSEIIESRAPTGDVG